ncbi:MAG: MobA/MobL family protein [Janthinobacterium lividum]
MAIFDWDLKTIKRSAARAPSRSAVAAAAYRSGSYLRDMRTGMEHDYTQRRGLYSEIVLPPGVAPPAIAPTSSRSALRSQLWNNAEAAETRRNSVVAREIILALPHELSKEDHRRLTRAYTRYLAERFGVAAEFSIHPPSRTGDHRNDHVHILFTTRRVSDGFVFGAKTRELDAAATGGPIVKDLRRDWAAFANHVLLMADLEIRIDPRSLADRGIERAPGHHVGPQATHRARALRGMAARLQTEADDLEREAMPHVWPSIPADVITMQPERAPDVWMEWAALYEQQRLHDVNEIEDEVYEPEGFDWSTYRPVVFKDWARERYPPQPTPTVQREASQVQQVQILILDEGDMELPMAPARVATDRPAEPEESRATPTPLPSEPSSQDRAPSDGVVPPPDKRPDPPTRTRRTNERGGIGS